MQFNPFGGLSLRNDKMFSVESSQYGREDFVNNLRPKAPDLEGLAVQGEGILPMFRYAQVDTFNWFYKGNPVLKELDNVSSAVEPHRRLFEQMQGMDEFKQLKTLTNRNRMASLIATRTLNQVVEEMAPELTKAIRDHQEKMQEVEDSKRRLESLRSLYRAAQKQGATKGKLEQIRAQGIKARQEALERIKEASQTVKEMREQQEAADGDMSSILRSAMAQSADNIRDFQEAMSAFGCGNEAPSMSSLPLDEQLELAREIMDDEELKRIARMAGRIQRIVDKAKKSKIKPGSDTIVDVTMGKKFNRLTGSEKVRLAHPVFQLDVIRRTLEGRALNWVKEHKEAVGRGPIICCVDNSGSMSGEPIVWAKAIALVLYRECVKRKKPFVYIHFSSGGYGGHREGFKVQKFDATPGEELKLLRFTKEFLNGGTDFELAFDQCELQFDDSDFAKADVSFISDMCFPIDSIRTRTEEFKERLDGLDAKCMSVLVGHSPGEEEVESFKHFSHACWGVDPYNTEHGSDESCISELFADNLASN